MSVNELFAALATLSGVLFATSSILGMARRIGRERPSPVEGV